MGKKTDHASVIHLVKMYPIYKKSNIELAELESCFQFKSDLNYDEIDRIHYLQNEYRKLSEKNQKLKKDIKLIKLQKQNPTTDYGRLLFLFKDIPKDKIDEVIERVNLLKKSWSWKSNDKCEIIESGTSMNDMHW
tara:strand:- start:52 stop:456 length:405 start_codon:yes stop_codon:yes gene_type:complete